MQVTTSRVGYSAYSYPARSATAYMLMYRRIDPDVNVSEVSQKEIPKDVLHDMATAAAEKKEKREREVCRKFLSHQHSAVQSSRGSWNESASFLRLPFSGSQ